jgi:hypothetical protein
MSDIKIDKDIPVPPTGTPSTQYPFAGTEVGNSFVVADMRDPSALRTAASRFGRLHQRKYTVRQVGDGAFRIWRIA